VAIDRQTQSLAVDAGKRKQIAGCGCTDIETRYRYTLMAEELAETQ